MLIIFEHFKIIIFPFSNDFREGHIYSTTTLLLKGINPYSLDAYPVYLNSYGILYNLVVYPFAILLGNSLELHRSIVAVFIFATIYVISRPSFKLNNSIFFNAICFLLLYWGFIYGPNSITRPDALGIFLYVLTIVIPIRANFSTRSIVFSMIFALLAFYAKPYYLFGWIILSIYMFFYKGMKRTILYNLFFASIFILLGVIVFHIFPMYFYQTIFVYKAYLSSFSYSVNQFYLFFYSILPLVFFLVIFLVQLKGRFLNLMLNPYFFLSVIISLFLIYPLGLNGGAFLTYHLQLLLPLVCLFLLTYDDLVINKLKNNKIVIVIMILLLLRSVDLTPNPVGNENVNWLKMSNYIDNKHEVLNGSLLAPMLLDKERRIYDNGATCFVFDLPKNVTPIFLFGFEDIMYDKQKKYINDIIFKIKYKKFDAIILTPSLDQGLYKLIDTSKYCFKRQEILINPHDHMSWKVDVFEPK